MAEHNNIYYTEGLSVPETPAPGEEPAFWKQTRVVGKRIPRVDAYERVSGAAVYPSDITLPNMIYGAVLRSPHPHANLTKLDVSRAKKMPGVRAVITGQSPEAKKLTWKYNSYTGPLFDTRCRFEGEAVAAVAADTHFQAWDAVRAIDAAYEVLPFVADHSRALSDDAPDIHDDGNLVDKDEY
ncbi:MAG: hypothetical protein LC657_19140, partial [Desulfobacteraceae bacterium]|nr:hypothetical protein [Desulfobacteraceae bacterium]